MGPERTRECSISDDDREREGFFFPQYRLLCVV
ncbi:hypothetical protein RHRU231_720041 [Rhodococcus ruber]|uniref:Uncharacterized protein n=1 Tax=Rhodococcus ruber TaxID=1830 RepID=A0A098BPI4_9NOCA|nr:hypothetical protein RHRU231_720041 [Rhodococcus ruber]